jgi:hypothetical protein
MIKADHGTKQFLGAVAVAALDSVVGRLERATEQSCRALGGENRGSWEPAKQQVGCRVDTYSTEALAPSRLETGRTRLKCCGIGDARGAHPR